MLNTKKTLSLLILISNSLLIIKNDKISTSNLTKTKKKNTKKPKIITRTQ